MTTPSAPHQTAAAAPERTDRNAGSQIDAAPAVLQRAGEAQEEVPCLLCGADAPMLDRLAIDRLFGQPGAYRIVRCTSCDMRYVSPRPTFAALGAHYPDDYFPYRSEEDTPALLKPFTVPLVKLRWRSYVHRFEQARGPISTDTKIVDVGSGKNDFLSTVRELRGCVGTAVDFKPEMVAYVRDKLKMPIFEGTLQQAAFPAGSVDAVTMNEYLEHEPDPRAVLAEARRITRKGGHLAVEIPFTEGLPAKLFGARWSQIDAPRHLSHFTRATLAEMLRRSGYKLIHTRTFQVPFLIGMSVLQAFGAKRLGRMGLLDSALVALTALPFFLVHPLMDEFMFAVAEAE
jgi:ubiquinone/menaquinone biosynthesis C-methylase UbiE